MKFEIIQTKKEIKKVIELLKMGGKSKRTINNYAYAINRFLEYFDNTDVSLLTETDIIEYMKKRYLSQNCSANTYNLNISAIKYFYIVNFNKSFDNRLLPHAKLAKRLPIILEKEKFLEILNNESNLKHKCWLLLGYCSGLRVEEVATIKLENIDAKEHKLKVYGKGQKERFTFLPDITINHLREYYKSIYFKPFDHKENKSGYLFEGISNAPYINSSTIVNYFTSIKKQYGLDERLSFHSLRHSFATYFIKAGGDPFVLKSMLGHSALNTTSIYIHMGNDFNNLKGVKYE